MIRRPPRSTQSRSSAASDVYKRQAVAGVDAGYGTMQVLWGVDLDVRPGETVLLLGANGAGKTTFLKTLVGLIEARQGAIQLAGQDVTRMRSSDRMRLGMTY